MVIGLWQTVGTSVRGPGHVLSGLPNQDAFRVANYKWGDIAVVSDGVGSCPTSERGSAATCRAVIASIRSMRRNSMDVPMLLDAIPLKWLERLRPFKPEESSATCLFVFRPAEGQMVIGMLGDGLIAVLKRDGSYRELCDNKEDCFSNQTVALSASTTADRWCTMVIDQEECEAVLLCTDGVADDLRSERREDFVRWLFREGESLSASAFGREIRKMLKNWPTPKHSDDKTIACLFRRKRVI